MKKYFLILIVCAFFVKLQTANFALANFDKNYKVFEANTTEGARKNVADKKNILFIIDFSNSMNEPMEGTTKIALAVQTMKELLAEIPNDVNVGLRIYGHSSGFTYLMGCTSSKLFVPLGTNNRNQIIASLGRVNAVGWTPITYSLKQAVHKDFAGIAGHKHIILLTDGGENCDESPCTYSINLMKTREDISIDVIAFDLNDYEAKNQLRCTSYVTRGKFYDAKNSKELKNSLFDSLNVDKSVKGQVKVKTTPF